VGKLTVTTVAQAEDFLQMVQRLGHSPRVGIRAEESARRIARAAINAEPWEGMAAGEPQIRKTLIVAQHHVVLWVQCLDQVVLEQQRLGLRTRYRDFHGRDLRHQRLHLRDHVRRHEITADPIAQAFRLADVEQGALGIKHAIDAGSTRQTRDERTRIEWGCRHGGRVSHGRIMSADARPGSTEAREIPGLLEHGAEHLGRQPSGLRVVAAAVIRVQ